MYSLVSPRLDLTTAAGAQFDASGAYRYLLWRTWQPDVPKVAFIMLNPSTADASRDDATIRRCRGFAHAWGYGGLVVANLFAYRATRSRDLRAVADPVGAEANRYLQLAVLVTAHTFAAWGNGGCWGGRDRAVQPWLKTTPLYCLGQTKLGCPRHPLYVSKTTIATPFTLGGMSTAGNSPS
ncbi:MAG: DUF1643 domain-containing protein [Spirulinaceae cyanobacterium SM2_1_0]|nr:DUF1643 domain-containing protein [Spirulinaceae cyanobacterium SM2_1_0]